MTTQSHGMTLQSRGMTLQSRGMTLQSCGMTLQSHGMTIQSRGRVPLKWYQQECSAFLLIILALIKLKNDYNLL